MPLLWSFVAGLPVGVLAVLLVAPMPSLLAISASALAAGITLAALVFGLGRLGGWEPERGRHLARAASAGLLALPAIGALLIGLPPHPAWAAGAVLLALAAALTLGSRRRGPGPSTARHALAVAGAVVAFSLGIAALSALVGLFGGDDPVLDEPFVRGVLDVDARVSLRPEPRCEPALRSTSTLLDRGAHPRLSPDGRSLWFDAEAETGARQIYRLDREDGVLRCFTCGEPGDNRRPATSPNGLAIVFDSDRHATWRHPTNTEVHVLEVRENETGRGSIRLTRNVARDDHALYDPSGRGLVWTRGGARFEVVRAALRGGHGGVVLTGSRTLAADGLRWPAALGWSSDARQLALGVGHPLRPMRGRLLDPASGEEIALPEPVVGAAVSFSADGTFAAVAGTRPSGAASLLPASLGFVLARLPHAISGSGPPGPGGTSLHVGPVGSLAPVPLGDVAEWGEPTGAALAPDGRAVVIGQRRRSGGAVEERLLLAELACEVSPAGS